MLGPYDARMIQQRVETSESHCLGHGPRSDVPQQPRGARRQFMVRFFPRILNGVVTFYLANLPSERHCFFEPSCKRVNVRVREVSPSGNSFERVVHAHKIRLANPFAISVLFNFRRSSSLVMCPTMET